ncbi:superoxide dismutase, Cu-Zn family [Oceanobacillus limi]|uniref:Superoxide dismutase, Cu-Zn family n=1 Tax=Oceanobacillus limi TaxID=930131 RepID=A0A1I0DNW1_9BACI|nr:superoxide dismutase family protein [Oceanobacillus limi]SET33899.1 superoxide dismutase, Cu-Zn family [Oceanobacillus limi]
MRYVLVVLLFLLASCQSDEVSSKTIDMYNTDGDMVGTAKLLEQPDGVQVTIKLEGLEPGYHGAHVHEFPKCDAPDFKTAGNHFDPEGNEHGLMHPEGAHLGDLPNVEADEGGLVDAELMLAGATLTDGKNSILTGEGTSLIITEGQDDGVSQPSGDSGARIICGEIKSGNQNESTESPTDPTELNEEQEE